MTSRKSNEAEVLGVERRRRWSAVEKLVVFVKLCKSGQGRDLCGLPQLILARLS